MTTPHDIIPPPKDAPLGTMTRGWTYNLKKLVVVKGCSAHSMHGIGTWENVNKSYSIALYSTPLRAAYGMREALLLQHRQEIEKVDKYIRKLEQEQ